MAVALPLFSAERTQAEAPSLELRPYQSMAIQHTHRAIDRGERRLYFTLPTGTGKSVVISRMTGNRQRVLYLAHRKELIEQLAERVRIDWQGQRPIGVMMGTRDESSADLVVGTPQSLRTERMNALLRWGGLDTIVIDEAHHATASSRYSGIIDEAMERNPDLVVVGCTATPFRADKQRMQDLLPTCTFARTIDDMQRDGYLCPLTWKRVQVDMDLSAIRSTQTVEGPDYRQDDLARETEREALVDEVVASTIGLLDGRPTLVFGTSVHHAQLLAEAYAAGGIRSAAVWGAMPKDERRTVLSQWHTGHIQLVSNVGVLTEGYDFPAISAIVMARPTRSPSLYMQMVGRGTRLNAGKDDCRVIDIVGNGVVDDALQITLADHADVDFGDRENSGHKVRRMKGLDSDQVYRWIRWRHGYLLSASKGTTLAMVADPHGSGLYKLASLQGPRVDHVNSAPGPIWEQQRAAMRWSETHAVPIFANRGQPWHALPATEKQLGLLAQIAPEAAKDASALDWDRSETSDYITRILAEQKATSIVSTLWGGVA